jgi:hypothetical protein
MLKAIYFAHFCKLQRSTILIPDISKLGTVESDNTSSLSADGLSILLKGGDPATGSPTATLLRLHPNHESYRGNMPPRRVSPATSSTIHFRDVTGGVYKTRERIHRSILICDY